MSNSSPRFLPSPLRGGGGEGTRAAPRSNPQRDPLPKRGEGEWIFRWPAAIRNLQYPSPMLSIVTVSYKSAADLPGLLESVEQHPPPSGRPEVVVVDNSP